MKKVGKSMFFIVAVLIIGLTALSFVGFSTSYGDFTTKHIKSAEDIRWGIDIRGGVDVTFTPPKDYKPVVGEGEKESDVMLRELNAAKAIINNRLATQNIADSEVYTDTAQNRIIVRFPWKEGETNFNPEEAVKELGETALLTIREGADGPVILEGKNVKQASVGQNPDNPTEFVVQLTFDEDGTKAISDATQRLLGQQISFWMDDVSFSSPVVRDHITDGKATMSGGSTPFTVEEARDMADKINGGALPFKLETASFSSISPTLGTGARDVMLWAGVIAFALISIFMIAKYRLPGMVAVIALIGQVGGLIACTTGFFNSVPSFTMTLPGIAGIILSIGMGVDANVITAERVKEEILVGKSIDSAVNNGFERTFSAIFDGNITVVIVAAILMGAFGPPDSFFGTLFGFIFSPFGASATGTIYSFGYTLLVGVVFNFLMGVTATRLMLKSIIRMKPLRKPWLYGGKKS